MPDLLLHSLSEFSEILLPALEIAEVKHIVEVGAECGRMTRSLIDHAERAGGSLVSIAPAPAPETVALFAGHARARLVREPSLEALPRHAGDAYLIDGDHNWWTVLNESRIAWDHSRRAGAPFLAFYHDVGWPFARRDQYRDPSRIPAEHLQTHSWDHGVRPGVSGVVTGGFRGEGNWAVARAEGGPRNGVLTAIEDFVEDKGDQLLYAEIPAVFGLGVLFERNASWADSMAALLTPWHMNPLLAKLERNRLDCYLTVIDWQDRSRDKAA